VCPNGHPHGFHVRECPACAESGLTQPDKEREDPNQELERKAHPRRRRRRIIATVFVVVVVAGVTVTVTSLKHLEGPSKLATLLLSVNFQDDNGRCIFVNDANNSAYVKDRMVVERKGSSKPLASAVKESGEQVISSDVGNTAWSCNLSATYRLPASGGRYVVSLGDITRHFILRSHHNAGWQEWWAIGSFEQHLSITAGFLGTSCSGLGADPLSPLYEESLSVLSEENVQLANIPFPTGMNQRVTTADAGVVNACVYSFEVTVPNYIEYKFEMLDYLGSPGATLVRSFSTVEKDNGHLTFTTWSLAN
jgi:hypothetical protein